MTIVDETNADDSLANARAYFVATLVEIIFDNGFNTPFFNDEPLTVGEIYNLQKYVTHERD